MVKEVTVPVNFIPRDYQLDLYQALDGIKGQPNSRCRKAILRWHRRAGKDKASWCYMIKEAVQAVGNYFYIFPTATQARRSLWENIDKDGFRTLDHLPGKLIKRINNQEMLIELENGSTIRVLGYDKNPDSIRGVACKGAVFSEFAFTNPVSYQHLVPVIEESEGWVIINSTPNGRNHFYTRWKQVIDSKNWFCSQLQTVWPDLPHYSGLIKPSEIERIKLEEGFDEEDIEREYGVSFHTGMKGSYYSNYIQEAHNSGRIVPAVYNDALPVFTVWDIGISDYDVAWFGQRHGNKTYWIDFYMDNGKGTDDIAEMLKDKNYEYSYHYLPHDAGHRKKGRQVYTTSDQLEESLEDFDVTGEIVEVPVVARVQHGIKSVRKLFPNFIFDSEMCKEGLEYLELYHKEYDHRRKCYLNSPKHDINSHPADAIRVYCEYQDSYSDPFFKDNKIEVLTSSDVWL